MTSITEKAMEPYTMTMNKGETVADYSTRFLNACRDGGVKDEPAWSSRHSLRLPRSVEEVLCIADAVTLKKRSRRQEDSAGPAYPKRRINNGGVVTGIAKKSWCPHHKAYVAHSAKEYWLKRTNSSSSLSTTENRFKKVISDAANQLEQLENHPADDILNELDELEAFAAAMIDSGAQISAINKSLCDKYSWPINYINGIIKYAGTGDHHKCVGTYSPLQISYNHHKPTFTFEVMELECEDVIVGKDLMPHIGLTITGLAVKWDDINDNSSKKDDLIDLERVKDIEYPAGSTKQRKEFFEQIQPWLDRNSKIPVNFILSS
ncbi:hypothetical protein BDA99DRAFT_565626 [Phascolomyces articulosus]|uniref:Uncharacterized protein n=1 Tax=Phascolomyces articulosus TaxID=60185 RepID=A0AAD5JMP1_9FUNG|nr:hypothetical protein BDA99DRAFT_565626 [Phascolomyces articulosus]